MTVDVDPQPGVKTRTRRSPPAEQPEPIPTTPAPPRMPGRRNPRWIALGVVAVCLGGLLSYLIYSRVATQTTVVAATRTIYRGETVRPSDLTPVTVTGSAGLNAVPAAQLEQLVGRKAAFDLVKGAWVPAGAIADTVIPAKGRAVVGVKLGQGRAPVGLLTPGSHLRLVSLPSAGAQPTAKEDFTSRTFFGRVVDHTEGADGTSLILNVDIAANEAPALALLAAQDRLAVLRDADR